jgi:pimeloyl-ACP methyl ester carboxylesterase
MAERPEVRGGSGAGRGRVRAIGRGIGRARALRLPLVAVLAGMLAVLAGCGSPPAFWTSAPGAQAGAVESGPLAGTTESIVAAPVRIAQTRLGAVGYRVVGHGPALVMIMGYGGGMEDWDPRFVDTLAKRFRVVIFDNAGIGPTQPLRSPLTIDKMAEQTSALITALGVARPDVLGYSMGGMIAQALAVLHPAQVRGLVLCATFPGTGTVIPAQSEINALTSGDAALASAALYPPNQTMASDAAAADGSAYPAAAGASRSVIKAQGKAALAWFHGTDPAGKRTSQISARTLVADGTDDRLDAVANDRAIAGRIAGSRLLLYADAGHGFLFQEGTPFAVEVGDFLAGPPAPVGGTRLRQVFLADESRVTSVARTWAASVRAVNAKTATTPEVAVIDLPYVTAIDRLDDDLLTSGASGSLQAAVARFVQADETVAADIGGLALQPPAALPRWEARTMADAAVVQRAAAALRAALGPASAG